MVLYIGGVSMAYFLKKSKQPGGLYLQIYFSYYNKTKKCTSHLSHRKLGYYDKLKASGIDDPISYFQKEVDQLNYEYHLQKENEKTKLIGDSPEKYIGYFLIKNIYDALRVSTHLDTLQSVRRFRFSISDVIESLIYSRFIMPASKEQTLHDVVPKLYNVYKYSYDQMLEALEFIGNNYEKIVEIFNVQVRRKYGLDTKITYFDCTNFYFEIDKETLFQKKGPSKENKTDPIVGLGLLLDENQIPIAMKMYPGNESEKPILPQVINNLKNNNSIEGKTIHVADKGLNCAKNIYEATKNGNGYLFSKSVKQLTGKERKWVLLDNDFIDVTDASGKILYRLKECVDTFEYKFRNEEGKMIKFSVKEKRVVTYNPKLAEKHKYEINKMVIKAKSMMLSQAKRKDFGDSSKYVSFKSTDENGEITDEKVKVSLNQKAIDKDLECAGYNMLVTSEITMNKNEIYKTYHNLWRIEESFKVMKSYLDARPVFLQKESRIYGHFLICYLSVLLLRILQFHCFDKKYSTQTLVKFIKEFKLVKEDEGKYINLTSTNKFIRTVTDEMSLPLTNFYLNDKQIQKMLEHRF